jgi:hypothetical protein
MSNDDRARVSVSVTPPSIYVPPPYPPDAECDYDQGKFYSQYRGICRKCHGTFCPEHFWQSRLLCIRCATNGRWTLDLAREQFMFSQMKRREQFMFSLIKAAPLCLGILAGFLVFVGLILLIVSTWGGLPPYGGPHVGTLVVGLVTLILGIAAALGARYVWRRW